MFSFKITVFKAQNENVKLTFTHLARLNSFLLCVDACVFASSNSMEMISHTHGKNMVSR